MLLLFVWISAILIVCSSNNCVNRNTYLAYLYRCQPEEFQELVLCVGSGESTRNRLGLRLACQNKKRIVVSFAAIEHIDRSLVTCDRQPVSNATKLDDCADDCKLETMANYCDGRLKCNPKLDEFLCFDARIDDPFDNIDVDPLSNVTSPKEYVIRVQYICVDDNQRLEYMNEINYNSESICQQSTTTTSPAPVIIPDASTTHLIAVGSVDLVPTQHPILKGDEAVIKNGNNESSSNAFNDVFWTANFLSHNVEKWVLYLILGLLIGLVLVLFLLLCLCCCYRRSSSKHDNIYRPLGMNVKQTRGSQTLTDSNKDAPRMIRFKRDGTLENRQAANSENINLNPVGASSQTRQPYEPTVNRSSSGLSSSPRKSMGWNRASDVPPTWPAPPAADHPEEHPVYPKTPYPPAVVIANNNASRGNVSSNNNNNNPTPYNDFLRKSQQRSSASSLNNNSNSNNRFIDRDSVFTHEQAPLLAGNAAAPRVHQQPQEHVWLRNSVQEGPEGINFYPSTSASPVRESIR